MRGRIVAATLLFAGASAGGHDVMVSPHLSCETDGDTALICLYNRHPTSQTPNVARPERPSRVGYADKGRYAFSCTVAGGAASDHRTTICRAGTGTAHDFQCWTATRRSTWLGASDGNEASTREKVTGQYVFTGKPLQETLFKFLSNPATAGRQHFLANDSVTARAIGDYARTCRLDTTGDLTLAELGGLAPLLALLTDD